MDIKVKSPIEVEAEIQKYTLVTDDIYVRRYDEATIPAWYRSLIENVLSTSSSITTLEDLLSSLQNIQDGYHTSLINLQNADESLLAKYETQQVSLDKATATIANLSATYATKEYAQSVVDSTIAATFGDNSEAAAWFDSKISTYASEVAALATANTILSAQLNLTSQDNFANTIDINILKKQADGVVETVFGTDDVVDSSGNILLNAEPYASWAFTDNTNGNTDVRATHTGDTYVKYALNNGVKEYQNSYKFTKFDSVDEPFTDSNGYGFFKITDSSVAEALAAALHAQATADNRINTYYLPDTPVLSDSPLIDESHIGFGVGDLWFDSNDHNKLYRYDGSEWLPVRDTHLEATVATTSAAVVGNTANIDNIQNTVIPSMNNDISAFKAGVLAGDSAYVWAEASQIASTTYNGNKLITGFTMLNGQSEGQTISAFGILADDFNIYTSTGYKNPFSITGSDIYFNGKVTFSSVDGGQSAVDAVSNDLAQLEVNNNLQYTSAMDYILGVEDSIPSFDYIVDDFLNGIVNWTPTTGSTITESTDGQNSSLCGAFKSINTTAANGEHTSECYFEIQPDVANKIANQEVEILIDAKKPTSNASNEFGVQYSTNAVGNSGWHKFQPTTSWKTYSFKYTIASPTEAVNRDYIGIWGDTSGSGLEVLIDNIRIKFKTYDIISQDTATADLIQTEISNREDSISNVIADVNNSINIVDGRITAEETARIAAINAEAQSRIDAISLRVTAEANLDGKITSEEQSRINAITDVSNAYKEYNRVVTLAIADGVLTPEEETLIAGAATELQAVKDRFLAIEDQVKLNSSIFYNTIDNFEKGIKTNISLNNNVSFSIEPNDEGGKCGYISASQINSCIVYTLDTTFSNSLAGQTITIQFKMKQSSANPSSKMNIAYFTTGYGNSGNHSFIPTSTWETYSFDYFVPATNVTTADVISIYPSIDTGSDGILIDNIIIIASNYDVYADLENRLIAEANLDNKITSEEAARIDMFNDVTLAYKSYTDVTKQSLIDGEISSSEANAINAAKTYSDSALNVYDTTINAHIDDVVTTAEQAAITTAQNYADTAKQLAIAEAASIKNMLPDAGFEIDFIDGRLPIAFPHTASNLASPTTLTYRDLANIWGLNYSGYTGVLSQGTPGTDENKYCIIYSDYYQILEGEKVCGSVYLGTHRCRSAIYIKFMDKNKNALSVSPLAWGDDTKSGGSYLSGYHRAVTIGTAPTGCVYMQFIIRKYDTYSTKVNSYLFYVKPQLSIIASTQTTAPVWVKGDLGTLRHIQLLDEASKAYADAQRVAAESYADGIVTEAENSITTAYTNYADSLKAEAYLESIAYTDGKVSASEQQAIDAAKVYTDAQDNLKEITVKAYADGVADNAELNAIADAQTKVNNAKTELLAEIPKVLNKVDDFENGLDNWTVYDLHHTIELSNDSFSGTHSALISSTIAYLDNSTSGHNTFSVYYSLDDAFQNLVLGKTIEVILYAKQPNTNPSDTFQVSYSTNAVGNSEWQEFNPSTEWQEFSFKYTVSGDQVLSSGEFLGIHGDKDGLGGGVLIDSVYIRILEYDAYSDTTRLLTNINDTRASLESQLDNKINTYFGSNAGATSPAGYTATLAGDGDMFYNTTDNTAYRFKYGIGWIQIKDQTATDALLKASQVEGALDSKVTSFYGAYADISTIASSAKEGDIYFTSDTNETYLYTSSNMWKRVEQYTAGSGINICNSYYSDFEYTPFQPTVDFITSNCTLTRATSHVFGQYALRIDATAPDAYVHLAKTGADYNVKLSKKRKWIISVYAQLNATNTPNKTNALEVYVYTNTGKVIKAGSAQSFSKYNTWYRFELPLDLTTSDATSCRFRIDNNSYNGAVSYLYVDGLMMEEQVGPIFKASPYTQPILSNVDVAEHINRNTTTVDGGKITTGSIDVDKIKMNTAWAGVIYDSGATSGNEEATYSMKIDLNNGEIHIK